jgi:hypothetical protein
MDRYEFRVNYTDGTFSVERVTAGSLGEALCKLSQIIPDDVLDTTFIGTVANAPVEPLVVFN